MKKFKRIIITPLALLAFIFLSTIVMAGSDVKFEWNANVEPDLAGYRLYQSTTSGQYDFGDGNQIATIPAGTETISLTDVPDGKFYWSLTAYDTLGLESGPSNEVSATLDTTAPNPPGNFLIVFIGKLIAFFKELFPGLTIKG